MDKPKLNTETNVSTPSYRVFKWSFPRRAFFRSIFPVVTTLLTKGFKYESFGLEHLNKFPEGTPLILAGNHRSHLDALTLGASILPPRGKRRYVATITPGQALDENPLFKLMRYLGAFPIDKTNPSLSLDYFYETLHHNLAILIFPQGGRMPRTPIEDYQKFSEEGRSGIGRLVIRTNGKVPVLPFYLHGTAEAMGVGSILPKFGSYVSVTFGEPMYFSEYSRDDGWTENGEFFEVARRITNVVMEKIQELCYQTEKPFFEVIERKLGKSLSEIRLSGEQSKKLRRKLRKWSSHPPSAYQTLVRQN
jgi:1-acyl-sn-glycerol-3-phosphate acyltransferase